MSFQHRAGAPRLIDWTGERCVPWAPDVQVVYEHLHRYMWAARLLGGRRVLDLGSGEGFGAAILAESASHVVGVDIDARTVEHSRLNYATANLEFQAGSALDLSSYDAGSFDAVVAFEIIEHVRDQERVLTEIARVLADDGILVMSTPDRRLYSEASGNHNPFHEHELGLEEFGELLEAHFPHVAIWGQRTITGSHINYHGAHAAGGEAASADADGADGVSRDAANFYIERSGDEWRAAGDPAALYCVAVASKLPIPKLASSTLADCDLGLLREQEREVAVASQRAEDTNQALAAMTLRAQQLEGRLEERQAEYGRALRDQDIRLQGELGQRNRDIVQRQDDIVDLRGRIAGLSQALRALEQDLAAARQLNRRTEESVTWQTFQKLRARLYGTLGESSLLGRFLSLSLRMMGRAVIKRPPPPPPTADTDDDPSIEPISLPEYENPKVSLVIPLYAHAELTRACLESIREQTAHVSYEVILVDDEADEDTKRLLDVVRGAKIVRNESNLGYLRSVNRGAAAARGRWLVLFNNDTEVTRGWLVAMLGCAESADDVGVVTPSSFIRMAASMRLARLCGATARVSITDVATCRVIFNTNTGAKPTMARPRRSWSMPSFGRRSADLTSATCRCTTRTRTSVLRLVSMAGGCYTSLRRSSSMSREPPRATTRRPAISAFRSRIARSSSRSGVGSWSPNTSVPRFRTYELRPIVTAARTYSSSTFASRRGTMMLARCGC